jgi:sugar phosphate isomerase/epimerase
VLIGAMNHPQRDVLEEIRWMARLGLEFIDLTLEPPAAASWRVNPDTIKKAVSESGMKVVGHTAYYLPIGSPFESLRRASVDELKRCLEIFSKVGARWMNIHPDRYAPMHDRAFYIKRDLESLYELIVFGKDLGVGVMIENLPGDFNTPEQLAELLDPMPDLGLHLDFGHSNLQVERNSAPAILERYGSRLRHVHIHDNKGGTGDIHMPLGAGTVDLTASVRALKNAGYDGTITLEVFTPDLHYVTYSRDRLRQVWTEISTS